MSYNCDLDLESIKFLSTEFNRIHISIAHFFYKSIELHNVGVMKRAFFLHCVCDDNSALVN